MSVGSRLKEARLNKKMSQKELADLAGITKGAIGNYENGTSHPKVDILYALLEILSVDANFIFQDEMRERKSVEISPAAHRIGVAYDKATPPVQKTVEVALEPWLDNGNTSTKKAPSKTEDAEFAKEFHIDIKDIEEKMIEIEVFDQPAAAGFGNYLDEGVQSSDISLPDSAVPYGTDFGIRISGDSMEPEIADGSIVFVRESLEIEDGEIGIFVLNDDAYCKRLDVDRRRRVVRLVSENDKYGDIVVQEHDTLRTVGRVIGSYLPEK